MSAYYDGSIRINTKLNTQGFNTGMQRMTASLGKLAATIGVAFSVTALVKMGNQAIDLASDIQEVDNVVSKSFGNMRSEMDDLAATAIEKLGMSKLTAYQTGSTFMSMGKSMVDSMSDAKDMALELTRATGNMASFFNVSQDTASTALKSIYTGETETLKQFGVVMTEVNLQQFAYEQGIKKSLSAMTQSEKVTLRYKYVLEQLAFIGNDFEDTQDSWANQTRILSEQWKELLSILGNGLISVLTPTVKSLNSILSALIDVANAAGKVISEVFGIQAQQMKISADGTSDATDAMSEYGNATEDAAKKAKNATAVFDDLNVLQKNSDETSGSVSFGSNITSVETEAGNSVIDQMESRFPKLIEVLKGGLESVKAIFDDFAVGDFFKAGQDTSNLVSGIFDFFSDAIEKVDWEEVGNKAGDFLAGIDWIQILKSIGKLIWTAIQSGITAWSSMFDAAPIETSILTALALLKYSGITSSLFSQFGAKITEALSPVLSSAIGTAFEAVLLTELTWYYGSEAIEAITGKEGWADAAQERGILGTIEDIRDSLSGLPATFGVNSQAADALSAAYEDIANGVIYTDAQLAKMQEKWQLSNDEMETLRQAMLMANPELMDLADSFTILWNASVETLQDIQKGMTLVADGTVSASSAFDEFSKPMWGMTDDALNFFQTMQDGSAKLKTVVAEDVAAFGTNMKSNISDSLSETDKEMIEWLNKLSGYTSSMGSDTVTGYNQGINDNISSSENAVTAWQTKVKKSIHDGPLKFGSPSKTMKQYGFDTVTGYNNGISDRMSETDKVIKNWIKSTVEQNFSAERWKLIGENIKNGFYEGFYGLANDIADILNLVIGYFEQMVNQTNSALNAMISGYNTIAGSTGGTIIDTVGNINLERIPKLAYGTVLHGGNPYLAVVNDQPAGQTNIEAPLDTIKQGLREELAEIGGIGQNVTIKFTGNLSELGRVLKPVIDTENARVGKSFKK